MLDSDIENESDTEDRIQDIEQWKLQHDEILDKSKSLCIYFMIANSIGAFSQSLWASLWINYAQTFDDNDNATILWLGYVTNILSLIATFILSFFCDVFGFGNILIIFIIKRSFAFLILSFCNKFYLFVIGFLILSFCSEDSLIFSIGFISKILPYKYSSIYIGYQYASEAFLYIVGTFISGILSYYINYKMNYLFGAILSIFTLIFSTIFIYKKEKLLISKQLLFVNYYDQIKNTMNEYDKHEMFPLCLRNNDNDNNDNTVIGYKKYYNFLVNNLNLILYILQYSLVTSLELIFLSWFPVYCNEKYLNDSNNIITMSINAFGILILVIWSGTTPVLYEKYKYLNNNKITILYICYSLNIINWIILPYLNNIYYWFIAMIPLHTAYSFSFITLELLIVEIQPPSHSGKINGFKLSFKYLFGSIGMLLIGYIWNKLNYLNEFKFNVWMYCYTILPVLSSIFLSIAVITKRKKQSANHVILTQEIDQDTDHDTD